MIPRYTRPAMAALWADEAKAQTWLAVELAVTQAQEALGRIPQGVTARCRANAHIDLPRALAIEEEVRHDVIAFLTMLAESLGDDDARYVHLGMTSSDLVDTALALQLRDAGQMLLEGVVTLRNTVYQQAVAHKHTVCIGRSHGVHGEPITFGIKLLGWVDALDRQHTRLTHELELARVGQVSGAMGTYAHLPPEVETLTCEILGLKPARHSTQVLPRDLHAGVLTAMALLASTIEQIATELRHLQRTEVLEVEEAFAKGQKGSSAMPHKRNPISGENLTGLARLVRSYALPALENIALWHERDISHSSVERVIFPDAFIALDYMVHRLNGVVANLLVHQANMTRNLNVYGGVIFTQRVLLTLVEAGMPRDEAYRVVQAHAHTAWNNPTGDFKAALLGDEGLRPWASEATLADCFNPQAYLTHVEAMFDRFAPLAVTHE